MENILVIALADAEQEAVAAVNAIMQKRGLPCYLMEPIIGKIYQQVLNGKESELAEARVRAAQADESKTTDEETEEMQTSKQAEELEE